MRKIVDGLLVLLATILQFFVYSYAYADIQGQSKTFNINEAFDQFARKSMSATLRFVGTNAYFYVDDKFWDSLDFIERNQLSDDVKRLSDEFTTNIYPKETSFWGSEPNPGIDNDSRILILLEQLKLGHGGYFSTVNGYSKSVDPKSNEREMIILSVEAVTSPYAKIFLAHEFQHLISFNQKELLRKTTDDVWFNELRSEYAITQTGYNDFFTNSNLERRAEIFFKNPSDSLTEWPNVSLDYSLVALFAEYIAETYGPDFLRETLHANLTGIPSINNILANRGSKDRFVDIFSNWLVANYINDDSLNSKFGYLRLGFKNFKAIPQRFTILSGSESNIFDYSLKPWQVYGHKFLISNYRSNNKTIRLSPAYNAKFAYADNLGRFGVIDKDFYVTDPTKTQLGTGSSPEGGLQYFFIFPINDKKISDFGTKESESFFTLAVTFEEKLLGVDFGSVLKNGTLIKKARESEVYVIEGKYKRYLRPEIITLYGHLDPTKVIEVDEGTFHSFTTSNYVRYVDEEQVYAVWPDGTKHWLNITPQQWDASGRDWGALFIINDLELNNYKIGADITR